LLSVFGVTGLTAVLSLKTIDEASLPTPESPKTLVVSSAAGSTGSLVL
jgi:NADPH-dependent curcumin reductase CurA